MSNSNLLTLSEIFNEKVFKIPDYQRGYSWEKQHIEEFWLDLHNLDDKRIHYTGMITIERKKENEFYYIIDGQQRLTTIMILLKVLLDRFKDEDWIGDDYTGAKKIELVNKFLYKKSGKNGHIIKVIFGYEKDNPSELYYQKNILGLENSEYQSNKINTLYTKNLQNAFNIFTKKLADFKRDKLEVLILKVIKQLKFNLYEIDINDGLDEFIIFETMNNRGKQLTTLELLKNRLIYLTTLFANDNSNDEINELRKDINEVWKTVYEYIGKDSHLKIEDDIFLRDHWIMYFCKYNRESANPERDFLLNKYFTVTKATFSQRDNFKEIKSMVDDIKLKEYYLEYNDIKSYILDLQKAIIAYYEMLNPVSTDYSEEIKKWISKINRLGFDTFKPLLMSVLMNSKNIEESHIVKILKLIENYLFIKFKTNKGSKTTVTEFYRLAYSFHYDKDIYKLIEKLDNFVYDNHKNKLFRESKFQDIIIELFDYYEGWYSWKGLNYLLYEYELYLQEQVKGETKLQWEEINKDSIEHIYPQNENKECWKEFNELKEDDKFYILHSLGNLVLLSSSNNSKIGNKCFDYKKEIFSKASYSTIEISKNDKWTQETIMKRGKDLLNFMCYRWNINLKEETINTIL